MTSNVTYKNHFDVICHPKSCSCLVKSVEQILVSYSEKQVVDIIKQSNLHFEDYIVHNHIHLAAL